MRNYKKSKKKIQIGFINLAFLLSAKIIPEQLSKVLNQSILCSVFNPCLLFEKEKKELEDSISKKINSLRGTQQPKKPKNEIVEKIEEVNELKSIDDIMTIYNK
jgi:predicted alpha/beta-fold hydrolase